MSNKVNKLNTVFHNALRTFGHRVFISDAGCVELEANPARANSSGMIPEADFRAAEDAVCAAIDAGERRSSVLGVTIDPRL